MSFKRFPAESRPASAKPREYQDDVFKSLDAVISDRGIPKPRGSSPRRENRRERYHSVGDGRVGIETAYGWKRRMEPVSAASPTKREEDDPKMESGVRRFGIGGEGFGKARPAGENQRRDSNSFDSGASRWAQWEEWGFRGECRQRRFSGRWGWDRVRGSEAPVEGMQKSESPASTSTDKGGEDRSGRERESEAELGWKRKREPSFSGRAPRNFEMAPRSKATVDPMACSLDDVILDRGITGDGREDQVDNKHKLHPGEGFRRQISFRELGEKKEVMEELGMKAEETVTKNEEIAKMEGESTKSGGVRKNIGTPLSVVNFFSGIGMIIEIKVGKRVQNKELNDIARKWRCMVQCGDVSGVAESERMVVAKEAACDRFIKNLKGVYPYGEIPPYLMPDFRSGGKTKPKIFVDSECDMRVMYDYTKGDEEDKEEFVLLDLNKLMKGGKSAIQGTRVATGGNKIA